MRISPIINDEPTLKDYIDEFILFKSSEELAEITRLDYQRTLKSFQKIVTTQPNIKPLKMTLQSFLRLSRILPQRFITSLIVILIPSLIGW